MFDYLAGKADLAEQESEHLQECDDCRDLAVELRRVIENSGDVDKARRLLYEEGKIPSPEELPKEVHEHPGLEV